MNQANLNNRPKVSFVIPVYNVGKYLRKCLDSVIKQTLSDVEIICVDDASMDDSWGIVQEYADKDYRIKAVHSYDECATKQNRGLSATRNRGITLAKGEYVLFLDSDDWLEIDAAERLYKLAHRENLDVLCYDLFAEYETEDLRRKFPFALRRTFCTETALPGQELFWRQELCQGYYSMAPLLFCRRGYLFSSKKKILFYEGIEHEDLLFGLEALMNAQRAASVDWQLYHYFRREQSITTQKPSIDKVRSCFIILYEQLRFLQSQKLSMEAVAGAGRVFGGIFKWFMDIYCAHFDAIKFNIKFFSDAHAQAFEFFRQISELYFNGYPIYQLNEQEISNLRNADNIIIYGAGGVGRRVAVYLSQHDIDNFIFAVTTRGAKSHFMGTNLHEIRELQDFCDDSIVLLSVMPDKQGEMMMTLNELGFGQVIRMIR